MAGLNSADEIYVWQELERRTNVDPELIIVSIEGASEAFNLVVAGGDLPDTFQSLMRYYPGGAAAALADGVVMDCAPYLHDYLPNLYNFLYDGTHDDILMNALLENGELVELDGFFMNPYPAERGLTMRKDWLDGAGLEVPTTIDEFHQALLAFRDNYGADAAYWVDNSGIDNILTDPLGVNAAYVMITGNAYPLMLDHDTVKYGHLEDNFYRYLELFSQWYEEGLIYHDFAYAASGLFDTSLLYSQRTGAFLAESSFLDTYVEGLRSTADPNADLVPVGVLINDEEPDRFMAQQSEYSTKGFTISSDCRNVDLVLTFFNYLYSEEGSLLANWGTEGYTFEYDENGNPVYTDLILGEGNLRVAQMKFFLSSIPHLEDNNKWVNSFTERQKIASDTWGDDRPSDYNRLPAGVTLTQEETEITSNLMSDIFSYSGEVIMRMEIGEAPLTEYETFKSTLESMGVQQIIDIYQDAYDRFLKKAEK